MKVFVLGTRGFPGVQGGVEKHCEELYPRLVKCGCEVVVCTRSPYFASSQRLDEWKGVQFKHIWAPRKKNVEAIIHTFLGIIVARINAAEILHVHGVGPVFLIPFARLLGMKVVFTHHGPDYQRKKWGKFAKFVLKQGELLGIKFATKVIGISRHIIGALEVKYHRRDLEFIPNGVSFQEAILSDGVLEAYGLKRRQYILTTCRFVPEKGLHDLIEAYQRIPNPGFKLVIAGDADHETEYSRGIKKAAGESDGIVLTGFMTGDPLRGLYSNAGLFVLPSYYEGLPISLLEALSFGLPVLVSDIPQNREIPLSEIRYFKAGDTGALAQKMASLFHDGICEEERKNYSEILRQNYDWDLIAQKTFEVYLNVS